METTDVIICGCGPTGAMLASQLNRLGVNSICLDKENGITTDPRGIALDEEGIRALQSAGVYDQVYTDIGQCMGIFNFVGGVHHDLTHPPFTTMDQTTSEGGSGHVGFICHKQPHLEKHLRSTFLSTPNSHCQLREQSTLTAISEDDDWVYATYRTADQTEKTIRGKYLVGADGKTGFTRKKYLEPKGILMQNTSQTTYEATWVAVNWKLTPPTPTSHPDFPLWKKGYSPEDVLYTFFPKNFRFLCNPTRPAVCGHFGPSAERLWRFEFVVQPGEDGHELSTPAKLDEVIGPYITHPGSRYGLPGEIKFPADCIETIRARPFFFAAKSCNKWSLGRVSLVGDAAHVFPPFGGQGIVSGFRDACSLAWRLKVACQPGVSSYPQLFEGWYKERKQQLDISLAATVENGSYVTEANPLKIFIRDTSLWIAQLIPSWRRELEKGARRFGMTRYQHMPGMHFLPELDGGLLLPQLYCAPLESAGSPEVGRDVGFTDNEIYPHTNQKQGLFQLLVVLSSVDEVKTVHEDLQSLDSRSHALLSVNEATLLVMDPKARQPTENWTTPYRVIRTATGGEFARSPLCNNRPEPKYYDEYRISKELPGKRYIIVRPDMFVFAACETKDELASAMEEIPRVLSVSKSGDS